MPTEVGGATRFNTNDPDDMRVLVQSPLFWQRSGPATQAKAVQFLRENPDAVNPAVPQQVLSLLSPTPSPEQESPAENTGEPSEEPTSEPPVQ